MAWPLLLFAALALPSSAAARPSAPATNSSSSPLTNVTLGVVVAERDLRSLLGPALELALEALEPQLSRAALCVRPVYASYRDCSVADEKSETLKAAHSPDVLLGLGCDSEDDDVGRRASDWGLPLVTAGHYYRDPEFKTMVYAGPAGSTLAVFLTLLHRRFHWTSRAAFALSRAADNSHPDHSLLRIRKRLLDAPKFIGARKKYRRPGDAVRFIRAHGRAALEWDELRGKQVRLERLGAQLQVLRGHCLKPEATELCCHVEHLAGDCAMLEALLEHLAAEHGHLQKEWQQGGHPLAKLLTL